MNRIRFKYNTSDVVDSLFKCIPCRTKRSLRMNRNLRPHYYFSKGEDKLQDELDVVTLLKSVRQLRLLTMALLNQRQKLMLKFQRKNLIETESSSSDEDRTKFDTLKLVEQNNPIIKLIVLGRMKRMITSYADTPLEALDRKMIRGIYIRNIKDFQEDYEETMNNKTLLMRLKKDMNI